MAQTSPRPGHWAVQHVLHAPGEFFKSLGCGRVLVILMDRFSFVLRIADDGGVRNFQIEHDRLGNDRNAAIGPYELLFAKTVEEPAVLHHGASLALDF